MKVKQVYEKVICDNCHKEIEYGSEDAIQCTLRAYDDYEDLVFCDEDCADEFFYKQSFDWSTVDKPICKENLYGAFICKDGIITNGHYALYNVEDLIEEEYQATPETDIDKIRSNLDGFVSAQDELPNEVLNISEAQVVSIANKDYYRLPFSKPYFLFDKELLDFIYEALKINPCWNINAKLIDKDSVVLCIKGDGRFGFLCANYFEKFDNENKFPF